MQRLPIANEAQLRDMLNALAGIRPNQRKILRRAVAAHGRRGQAWSRQPNLEAHERTLERRQGKRLKHAHVMLQKGKVARAVPRGELSRKPEGVEAPHWMLAPEQ